VTAGVLISKIATPIMDGIIVAITAGTFLYVGATEVRIVTLPPSLTIISFLPFSSFLFFLLCTITFNLFTSNLFNHTSSAYFIILFSEFRPVLSIFFSSLLSGCW
jgi:hypothetical protein